MKILVTGAAGFVGSHLSEKLADLGHQVIGIDNYDTFYSVAQKKSNAEIIKKKGVVVHDKDLTDTNINFLTKDTEIIYHCAAQPGISKELPLEVYLKSNVLATHNLIESVKKSASLKLFVYISTSSVYGYNATGSEEQAPSPVSYYGVTKLAAEQLVMSHQRTSDFPACSIRLFSVYGERERPDKLFPKLIKSILEDTPFCLYRGSKKHSRSFTYIKDIVNGLSLILDKKEKCIGQIINMGSHSEIPVESAIGYVETILGKKARIVEKEGPRGDQHSTRANIDKCKRILNYEPQTDIRKGLENEIEWFRGSA